MDEIANEKFYIFRLVSQTLKIIEFQADFTGSRNCAFVDLSKSKAPFEEMEDMLDKRISTGRVYKPDGVYNERVFPMMMQNESGHTDICEKRTDLAKIILHDGWKLKT